MDYIEFNPIDPAPYTDYVSENNRERNDKMLKISFILLGIGAFIGLGIYLIRKYNNQRDQESKRI